MTKTWDGKTNITGKNIKILEIDGSKPNKNLQGVVVRQYLGSLGLPGGISGNTLIVIDYSSVDGTDSLFLNKLKYEIY